VVDWDHGSVSPRHARALTAAAFVLMTAGLAAIASGHRGGADGPGRVHVARPAPLRIAGEPRIAAPSRGETDSSAPQPASVPANVGHGSTTPTTMPGGPPATAAPPSPGHRTTVPVPTTDGSSPTLPGPPPVSPPSSTPAVQPTSTIPPTTVPAPKAVGVLDWPQFQGGPQHAGFSAAVPPAALGPQWTYTPHNGLIGSAALSVAGGNIYYVVNSMNGSGGEQYMELDVVSAVTHALEWQWVDPVAEDIDGFVQPAIGAGGVVYLVGDANNVNDLLAVAPGGIVLWRVSIPVFWGDQITIGPDGTLYLQDAASDLRAIDPTDGHAYWTHMGPGPATTCNCTPAFSPDGATLYAAQSNDHLVALSAGPRGGQTEWSTPIDAPVGNGPSVGPDGSVYLATGQLFTGPAPGNIDAFEPDGRLKWSFTSQNTFDATPAVGPTGLVVAVDDYGNVYALDAVDGQLAWSRSPACQCFVTPSPVGPSATIGADGTVVYSFAEVLYAYAPDGTLLWSSGGLGRYTQTVAIGADGTLYVLAGYDNHLLAFSP
jgi:outer membrane protein assembly factor BamB